MQNEVDTISTSAYSGAPEARVRRVFSPLLRGGENPGGNSPDGLTPPLRSGENQAVNIDTPLRGGELPPGLFLPFPYFCHLWGARITEGLILIQNQPFLHSHVAIGLSTSHIPK